ncbi:hypothetical protein LIER_00598 [Lithospermum erythrorhizon]|uniref:FAD-binding PCMH-type domain-containing protein n=1 Tax=Lithospermum erythrorhizon TaxID=34254 RepID=A0AAV3NJ28_LITER
MFLLLLILFSATSCSTYAANDTNYDNFVNCLSENGISKIQASQIVYTPNNSKFTSVLNTYVKNLRFNTSTTPKPAIIVTPLVESHVPAIVLCTKKLGLLLKIRSGGHDYEGLSYVAEDGLKFIILDLFNLRTIDVDIEDETAWVQSGAMLGELYYRIWEKSRVHGFPGGVCPTVGVGGHFSGGGYGNMLRRHGLTVDHIVDARFVDVQGRILDRKSMGEDLFWAIRGGGGASFGVVLAYKINLVRVPEVTTIFRVERFPEDNSTDVLYSWQQIADKIDHDLFMRVLLQPVTGKVKGVKVVRLTFIGMFLGDGNRLMSVMDSEFPELKLKKSDVREMSWIDSVLYWANFANNTAPEALLSRFSSVNFLKRKSDYVQTPISKDGLERIFKKMVELGKPGFAWNPYGGRMSEISSTETPFPHRAGNIFKMQYSVNWNEEGSAAETDYIDQGRKLFSYMTPFVSKNPRSAYLNYRDIDIGTTDYGKNSYDEGKVFGVKYFNNNFDRLVQIKTKVDPGNFFRNEQSIPTLPFLEK